MPGYGSDFRCRLKHWGICNRHNCSGGGIGYEALIVRRQWETKLSAGDLIELKTLDCVQEHHREGSRYPV